MTKIEDNQKYLIEEFRTSAKVIDSAKGYISAPAFNLTMKPTVLKAAGDLIASYFRQFEIDAVHGIPHSGNYLATSVAMALNNGTRLHTSRKDQNIPASWHDVYRQEVKSFTTSQVNNEVFAGINLSFIKPGDRVLLVDDVCANGDTGVKIVSGLQEYGVKVVGFAVLFDKVWQGGLEKVKELGVEVFSCVRVEKIDSNENLILVN